MRECDVDILKARASEYIWKKRCCATLSNDEIYTIVDAVKGNLLDRYELSTFLDSQSINGMSMDELESLARALADSGDRLSFDNNIVYDKHSIGGVPGNKVSLIIVPTVAAGGLLIPKTSSRAVSSAGGTADVAEILMPVEFSSDELKEIVYKTKGAIVHGGSLNLAPAGDKLISEVSYPIGSEPYTQALASIMAKKLAVGANNVVVDIPVGGLKVKDEKVAERTASDFKELGRRLGMKVNCVATYGGQPVGRTVGPALEAREALATLYRTGPLYEEEPHSLVEKATGLAGVLLESAGVVPDGRGKECAELYLANGKALSKMKEIIEAQGGDPNIKPDDIPIGNNVVSVYAPRKGYVTNIDNSIITQVARMAGAPVDKTAGIILYVKNGRGIKKGDKLMEIYSESETRLTSVLDFVETKNPFTLKSMIMNYY